MAFSLSHIHAHTDTHMHTLQQGMYAYSFKIYTMFLNMSCIILKRGKVETGGLNKKAERIKQDEGELKMSCRKKQVNRRGRGRKRV